MGFGNNREVKDIAHRDIRSLTFGSIAYSRF